MGGLEIPLTLSSGGPGTGQEEWLSDVSSAMMSPNNQWSLQSHSGPCTSTCRHRAQPRSWQPGPYESACGHMGSPQPCSHTHSHVHRLTSARSPCVTIHRWLPRKDNTRPLRICPGSALIPETAWALLPGYAEGPGPPVFLCSECVCTQVCMCVCLIVCV